MTIQTEEKIRINEKEFILLSRPLDRFLELQDVNLELVPKDSSCWRGYIGTWEIINDTLYLVGIKMNYFEEHKEKLIPLFLLDKAVFMAYWYTGELRVALVEPTYYSPNHKPVYTKEKIYTIEEGNVLNYKIVENEIPEVDDPFPDLEF